LGGIPRNPQESPRILRILRNGGGTYNNLWSVAVLGHSASWSLVVAKGQGGSGWELVTPCARSAVADMFKITVAAPVEDGGSANWSTASENAAQS